MLSYNSIIYVIHHIYFTCLNWNIINQKSVIKKASKLYSFNIIYIKNGFR